MCVLIGTYPASANMCISRAVVRRVVMVYFTRFSMSGRVDVVHRIHLPALIVCVKGGEYALLESEYRLCRDFQRGKQLSAEQIARLRSSDFLTPPPPHPSDLDARPPDYVPELNRHALDEMEQYKSSCLRFLLPVGISAVSLILSLIALFK